MNITFKSVAKRFFLSAALLTVTCLLISGFDYYNKNLKDKKSKKEDTQSETETKDNDSSSDSKYSDMSSYSICLDPACGGYEEGNASSDGRSEKDDNLALATKVSEILADEMHFNIFMTRASDTDVDDQSRVDTANTNNCDAIISLRRAAYIDANHAQGFESFIFTGEPENSKALSDSIMNKLNATQTMLSGETAVGTNTSSYEDYYVNSASNMASVVVFAGYVTSEEDNNQFDTNLDTIARAIAEGIYEYINNN